LYVGKAFVFLLFAPDLAFFAHLTFDSKSLRILMIRQCGEELVN